MSGTAAQDVELKKCLLISPRGEQKSIAPQVAAIRIQEDITNPFITAEIDMIDGIGLLQKFPILGEETIRISFNTNPQAGKKDIEYTFTVFGVSNMSLDEKNNVNAYTLKAISTEAIVNASTLVGKGYTASYTTMIKDILTGTLKTKKKIDARSTLGSHNIVLPNKKPFQAIDMLRKRSTSSENPFAPMLMFETKSGFIFRDIAALIKEGKKQSRDDITYKYASRLPQLAAGRIDTGNRTLVAFAAPEKIDNWTKINNGAFNNNVLAFDVTTKTVKTYKFNAKGKSKSFSQLSDVNHSDAFLANYTGAAARTFILPVDSSRPDMFVDKFGERLAYTNFVFQNYSHAEIVSDDILEAGKVLYLDMRLETIPYTQRKATDAYNTNDTAHSGYYLIKRLLHEIHIIGGVPRHRMTCDLISDSRMKEQ